MGVAPYERGYGSSEIEALTLEHQSLFAGTTARRIELRCEVHLRVLQVLRTANTAGLRRPPELTEEFLPEPCSEFIVRHSSHVPLGVLMRQTSFRLQL